MSHLRICSHIGFHRISENTRRCFHGSGASALTAPTVLGHRAMAVMLSDDLFGASLDRFGGGAAAAGAAAMPVGFPPGTHGGGRPTFMAKHMRLQTFDGSAAAWGDWAFGLKRAVRSQSRDVFQILEEVEKRTELDEDQLVLDLVDIEVERLSGEVYDILCQSVSGEAMAIVRSVEDYRGFQAWQKLHLKYKPRTMARAIRLMGEVVKDIKEVPAAIQRWEGKLKVLQREFGEKLSDHMKIAILTSTMPTVIQDYTQNPGWATGSR